LNVMPDLIRHPTAAMPFQASEIAGQARNDEKYPYRHAGLDPASRGSHALPSQ